MALGPALLHAHAPRRLRIDDELADELDAVTVVQHRPARTRPSVDGHRQRGFVDARAQRAGERLSERGERIVDRRALGQLERAPHDAATLPDPGDLDAQRAQAVLP